jgi:hypothetical protein
VTANEVNADGHKVQSQEGLAMLHAFVFMNFLPLPQETTCSHTRVGWHQTHTCILLQEYCFLEAFKVYVHMNCC